MPADLLGLNTGSGIPDTSGASYETTASQDRANALQQHRTNVQMSLLAAGLAMMAARPGRGRGQFARAVGEGGLTGLQSYETGEENIARQQQATAEQRGTEAYRQSELATRVGGLQEQRHRTDVMQEDARARQAAAERSAQATADYRKVEQEIAAANLSLNSARTNSEIAVAQSTLVKNQQALQDSQPYGRDPFAKWRDSRFAHLLPSPEEAAQVPRGKVLEYQRQTLATFAKPGFSAKEMTPKDISQTIKSLTPKDYVMTRIEPDDTVVFENSGLTGGAIWGPIKIKVPGSFEKLGPNATPNAAGPIPASASPIPEGAKPVYDSSGALIGYRHDTGGPAGTATASGGL